jgi:pyridoxamine 5'-phosphate oxidase
MNRNTDPIAEFIETFERAKEKETGDATVCALATASDSGAPSVRMVLLKGVDEGGFVFFTNYSSRKSRELEENPRASLCFHWENLRLQVRVEGPVEKISAEESDEYYDSRSRTSQIGAWASKQSQPLASRRELLARVVRLEAKYALGSVPRPPFWGGFRVIPERMEFWFDQPYRLHDRFLYTRESGEWVRQRLYP